MEKRKSENEMNERKMALMRKEEKIAKEKLEQNLAEKEQRAAAVLQAASSSKVRTQCIQKISPIILLRAGCSWALKATKLTHWSSTEQRSQAPESKFCKKMTFGDSPFARSRTINCTERKWQGPEVRIALGG